VKADMLVAPPKLFLRYGCGAGTFGLWEAAIES